MKKNYIIKYIAYALLCAILFACGTAAGEARMPENRGVLTDDADVLSKSMANDIAEYAKLLERKTDVELHVAIVHFLDGMDVKSYADALFKKWGLGKHDLLIVGAAGEDSFAMSMGSKVSGKLGEKSAETLMYTSSGFSDCFREQRYNEAFGSLFVAMNSLAEKRYDTTIKLGKLFEDSQLSDDNEKTPQSFISHMLDRYNGDIKERGDSYQSTQAARKQKSSGMGLGGWVVLGIIALIVFGQSDPVRKARRMGGKDYRGLGCGCSPLGWIFSIFGLGVIINNLRGRR